VGKINSGNRQFASIVVSEFYPLSSWLTAVSTLNLLSLALFGRYKPGSPMSGLSGKADLPVARPHF